ncbi:hypothetical protein BpHYR1_032077 [Brachionus plicatilis]|uniref:Uncharacterized protein n=1 Tax=Brachionus plicatilis TaxID=10195 RepID=A0A3M7T7G0_BRAPC|nr:hypothetical protein BpHYR1_032077 [Brachionus plicatilis]
MDIQTQIQIKSKLDLTFFMSSSFNLWIVFFGERFILSNIEIRWNSYFQMQKRAIKILKSLIALHDDILFENEHFEKGSIVINLLEPFNQSTLDLSGNSYNSCGQFYIIFDKLITYLDTKHKDQKYAEPKLTIELMKN